MALYGNTTAQRMNQINAGTYRGPADVQDHFWYDTLEFGASTISEYKFFTNPQSSTKGLTRTNLQDSGKFPTGQAFTTAGLQAGFIQKSDDGSGLNTTADTAVINAFYTVMKDTTMEVRIAGREFDFQAPASVFLPAVTGAGSSTSATDNFGTFRVGDFEHRNWLPLVTDITIGELVSFNVRAVVNTQDADVQSALTLLNTENCLWRFTLRGTLKRLK